MRTFLPRLLKLESIDKGAIELQRIGVDVCGIAEMTPKMQTLCIQLSNLECRQANILKQEMLSLGADAAVARGTVACSIDKTDCLLIGTPKQLARLSRKLKLQPFGLSGLAAELEKLLAKTDSRPIVWQTSRRSLTLQRPLIMGILNVTPDSFSDGGTCSTLDLAIEKALRMEAEGADIIDIGGESSRPGAVAVSLEEEISRVIPVIDRLSTVLKCAISVDTWKSDVARKALNAGAEIVNDISGFHFDSLMPEVVNAAKSAVVLMHTRGKPEEMQQNTQYSDLISEVYSNLQTSISIANEAGIDNSHIAVDPGIGFGKDLVGNLELIRRLKEFSGLALPILVGSSRKSFIGEVLGRERVDERLFGTAATVAIAVANGASILRVHDVREMRDVADMTHAVLYS